MKFKSFCSGLGLFLGVAGTTLFLFQNCSNVRLQKMEAILESTKAEGVFCSAPAVDDGAITNIIFVLDMSGSNVRKFPQGTFVRAGATDLNGDRFRIVREFLNTTCAKSSVKNRFAVVGFTSSIVAKPLTGGNCDKTRLVDANSLDPHIKYLEEVQAAEPLNPPTSMLSTVYEQAIRCAGDIVRSDIQGLASQSKQNAYSVFFLSDGGPTTVQGSSLPDNAGSLFPIYSEVDQLIALSLQTAGVSLQPVLYGSEILKAGAKAEYDLAIKVMVEMAKRGETVETAVTDPSKINICELLTSGKRIPFSVTDFGVVNLNIAWRGGKIVADSDMDGIPDAEEVSRGFNPVAPRSGVGGNESLDGFCPLRAEQCIAQTNCGLPNRIGLTQCEVNARMLKDGLDSDQDGLPDLVEFLRGTLPLDPTDKTTDVDGDGVTNYLEVQQGRDPNYWDTNVDTNWLLQYNHSLSPTPIGTCPSFQQSWKFALGNIPIVPTKAVNPTDPISKAAGFYQHSENENVLFVYYIIRQANDSNSTPGQIYGQFIKATANHAPVLGAFKKMGSIDGKFFPVTP